MPKSLLPPAPAPAAATSPGAPGDGSAAGGPAQEWADLVRQIRRLHAWSQEALAERLNSDQATVSRWERGVARPAFAARQQLEALAAAAGLPSLAGVGTVVRVSPFPMLLIDAEGLVIAASAGSGMVAGETLAAQTPADERAFLDDFQRALVRQGFWSFSGPESVEYAYRRGTETAAAVVVALAVRGRVYALVQKR